MGYIGFRLGLGAELLKIAGLTAGFFAGFKYYQHVGDFISRRTFLSPEWSSVLALVAIVSLIYFLFTRVALLLQKVVQISFEKRVNQFGGLAAGLVRALLISSVVLVACQQLQAPAMQDSIQKHSMSGRAVSRMAPAVYDQMRAFPRRMLAELSR